MKNGQPQTEKMFEKDVKIFEKLPAKTKESAALKDGAEKTIGPESVGLIEEIREKAKQ